MIDHTHHQNHAHHASVHTHITAHAQQKSTAHKKPSTKKHTTHTTVQKKTPVTTQQKLKAQNKSKHRHSQTYTATAQTSKHKKAINVSKFSSTLALNAHRRSTEKCAKHVRLALESAGAQVVSHPIAAADWGRTLEKIGYKQISPAFNNPQKGDIYIISRTKSHEYGHIAGYTGKDWVSDFRQNGYAVYSGTAHYKYYRLS